MTPYPPVVPLSEIQSVVKIVRGGTVVADRAAFAKDVWEVLGYAQLQAFGEPGLGHADLSLNLMESTSASPPMSDDEVLATLDQLSREHTAAPHLMEAFPAIPWLALIKGLLTLILPLL